MKIEIMSGLAPVPLKHLETELPHDLLDQIFPYIKQREADGYRFTLDIDAESHQVEVSAEYDSPLTGQIIMKFRYKDNALVLVPALVSNFNRWHY